MLCGTQEPWTQFTCCIMLSMHSVPPDSGRILQDRDVVSEAVKQDSDVFKFSSISLSVTWECAAGLFSRSLRAPSLRGPLLGEVLRQWRMRPISTATEALCCRQR